MPITSGLMSSLRPDWGTPQAVFDGVQAEFGLTLDVCADAWNAKLPNYYSLKEDGRDGLALPWLGRVWCNPPYGRTIAKWIARAAESVLSLSAEVVVMLLPARTDTRYWHRYIWDAERHAPRPGVEVRFLPGRLRFTPPPGVVLPKGKDKAPFPSCIVIFRGA